MAAAVTLSAEFFDDPSFDHLGVLLDIDPDLARMKVARLWSWQTEHYSEERPTYVIPEGFVIGKLGAKGPAAMIEAGLAERRDGGLQIVTGSRWSLFFRAGPQATARRTPRPTITYVVQCSGDGPVKIGRSGNFQKRLRALQGANADGLRVIHKIPGDHERTLHRACAPHRLHGEWFAATPEFFTALARAMESL